MGVGGGREYDSCALTGDACVTEELIEFWWLSMPLLIECCEDRVGRLTGADMDIELGKGGISPYGGGGRESPAVGELVPLTREFKDGEYIPLGGIKALGDMLDWKPYGVLPGLPCGQE